MLLESSLRINHQKQSRFFDGAHVRDALAAMPVEVADASTKSALWDLYVELSGRHELPLIKVNINDPYSEPESNPVPEPELGPKPNMKPKL